MFASGIISARINPPRLPNSLSISPVPRVCMVFKDYGADGQNDIFFSGAPPAHPDFFYILDPKVLISPLRNSHFSDFFARLRRARGFSLMTSYKPTDAHRWRCQFSQFPEILKTPVPSVVSLCTFFPEKKYRAVFARSQRSEGVRSSSLDMFQV